MTTYIVWMLLISHGAYNNRGNITVIDNLPSQAACVSLSKNVPNTGDALKMRCVRIERVKP